MAVEEVSVVSHVALVRVLKCPQEFAIEIPDKEADEIKTVQQGMCLVSPGYLMSLSDCGHSLYSY